MYVCNNASIIHLFWRKHGAILIENIEIPNLSVILDMFINGELIALPAEFKLSLNAYLSDLSKSPVRSLTEIIEFNNEHPIEVCFYFGFQYDFYDVIQLFCFTYIYDFKLKSY